MAVPYLVGGSFEELLFESFEINEPSEGNVIKGKIVAIEKDLAVIDVGLKTEGRVPLKEFGAAGRDGSLQVGSEVEVYVDRVENAMGEAVLSREKARREESWVRLEGLFNKNERVEGIIFNQVKGGFTVDLDGATAFLPRSQVDIRPIRDIAPLMNVAQPFQILKMDKRRGNIVVSRRAVLEESRAEQRSEIVGKLEEGQVVEGVVKNITDYGAFVDLGGIDGLLHVTDIAWRRVNHPSEVLSIGETIKVQIIRVNLESHRISLGMKQLEADPWETIDQKYPLNSRFTGRITNITDYGAFVELEPGIEGLIHVSEMSWTKKNVHPGKIVSTSQEVEVKILEVDPEKRRISLGLKQCLDNPWEAFAAKFPAGTEVEGEVKNKTEFGLFIGLEDDVDGMVHLSDLDWNRQGEEALEDYNRGDVVKAVVLDVDVDKERVSLGIKQLSNDPFTEATDGMRKGSIVTCTVSQVNDGGIEVQLADGDMTAFIKRSDLSRDRSEQRPERFAVGDKIDARIVQFDRKTRRMTLSIKALEIAEEKEAVAQYGSTDSGASLGDILGVALQRDPTTISQLKQVIIETNDETWRYVNHDTVDQIGVHIPNSGEFTTVFWQHNSQHQLILQEILTIFYNGPECRINVSIFDSLNKYAFSSSSIDEASTDLEEFFQRTSIKECFLQIEEMTSETSATLAAWVGFDRTSDDAIGVRLPKKKQLFIPTEIEKLVENTHRGNITARETNFLRNIL